MTDNTGAYAELLMDDIYVLYEETGLEILEWYEAADTYAICNWDGDSMIEYDDGSGTAGTEITPNSFVGEYYCDESFEVEGHFVNNSYMLIIEWNGSMLAVTESWRGNNIMQIWINPRELTRNTLSYEAVSEDGMTEIHTLTYLPASDSVWGKDTIYIDGDDSMPFVSE